jgi:hypothetical protein
MVRSGYLDWAAQAESVFQYLCDPTGIAATSAAGTGL